MCYTESVEIMKGTTTMSKIGQSIIDTPLEDQSDPNEPSTYGADHEAYEAKKAEEREIGLGHLMHDIDSSISHLEKDNMGANPDELRAYADRLQDLAAKIEKPF